MREIKVIRNKYVKNIKFNGDILILINCTIINLYIIGKLQCIESNITGLKGKIPIADISNSLIFDSKGVKIDELKITNSTLKGGKAKIASMYAINAFFIKIQLIKKCKELIFDGCVEDKLVWKKVDNMLWWDSSIRKKFKNVHSLETNQKSYKTNCKILNITAVYDNIIIDHPKNIKVHISECNIRNMREISCNKISIKNSILHGDIKINAKKCIIESSTVYGNIHTNANTVFRNPFFSSKMSFN